MKKMTPKNYTSITTGSLGLIAGFVMAASMQGNIGALVGLGVSSIPISYLANLVNESKNQEKLNVVEKAKNTALFEWEKIKTDLNHSLSIIEKLQAEYAALFAQYTINESEKERYQQELKSLPLLINELSDTKKQVQELLEIKEQYEIDWQEEMEKKEVLIAQEVKVRVKQVQKGEIQRIWDDCDRHSEKFLKGADECTELMILFKEKADGAKEMALDIAESARKFREEKNKQIEALLEELDCKNTRIAIFQQELRGILLEPEYVDAKYNPDLDLGNAICREIFQQFKIPLRFYHAHSSEDGITRLGFIPSRAADTQAIAQMIGSSKKSLVEALKLYEVVSAVASPTLEGIEVVVRRSRPQPPSEEIIYRILTRASDSCKALREAMNPKKGGAPTLRIMGATGQGKGIILKNFIAYWVKHESGEIWFSDPMDGSDEDRWEIPKVAKSKSEGSKVFRKFVAEYDSRVAKSSPNKSIKVLGIFDEFDREHPQDDKAEAKRIWTAIRQHNMHLILLGQSAEVGENKWKWDEMGNCALLFVGRAIGTAIKHSNKDLGIAKEKVSDMEKKHELIKAYFKQKNADLDLEGGEMYRVALLISGDDFRFLELPQALNGSIESDKSTIVERPWETIETLGLEKGNPTNSPVCKVCGSDNIRKKGQRWTCNNPNHNKEMGVKSWAVTNS